MGIEDKLSGGFVTTTTEWLFGLTRECQSGPSPSVSPAVLSK